MRYTTFALLGVTLVTPIITLAQDLTITGTDPASTTPPDVMPSNTCVSITKSKGSPCAEPSGTTCTTAICYGIETVTQSCGCASIGTVTNCLKTCDNGCHTAYFTVTASCPTVTPTSTITSSESSVSSGTSSTISSTSSLWTNSSTTVDSSTEPTGMTTITVTSITTLTTCPHKVHCTGQITSWIGTNGPFQCSARPTCTCYLPGGTQTIKTCPKSTRCTGQSTRWTSTNGPTPCPESVTCNWVLPTEAVVTDVTVVTPTQSSTSTAPTTTGALQGGGGVAKSAGVGVVLGAVLVAFGML